MIDISERKRLVSSVLDAIDAHTREDGHVDGGCIENLFSASGWLDGWASSAAVVKEAFAAIANTTDDDHLLKMGVAAEEELNFAKEIQAERVAIAALEALGIDSDDADRIVTNAVSESRSAA